MDSPCLRRVIEALRRIGGEPGPGSVSEVVDVVRWFVRDVGVGYPLLLRSTFESRVLVVAVYGESEYESVVVPGYATPILDRLVRGCSTGG